MTKWICNGCGGKPCKLDICNEDTTLIPTKCVRYTYQVRPCWKRDCTEEKKDELRITDKNILDVLQSMNRRIAYSDKKVQELITAGQGQMARIQALERQVKALHSHRHETMVAHYER